MTEPMTLTAYAQRRGVSTKAVSKAVAAGRLAASVIRDKHGSPKIADPDLADREWTANTRASVDRPLVEPPTSPPRDVAKEPVPTPSRDDPDDDPVPDYHAARARKETAAARREAALASLAELDLAERRGELVLVDQARADVMARFALVRTRLLGVPSRVAQRMPAIAAQVVPVLDDLIREALEELAGEDEGLAGEDESAQDGEL